MTDAPHFRAEVAGHFVQFFSRHPNIKTVRWHSRFKAEISAIVFREIMSLLQLE
jgi:hypothetical protein